MIIYNLFVICGTLWWPRYREN